MRITIIGSGYVGLVTGACLAQVGNDVLCLDTDAAKIAVLESGGVPIHEPGLNKLIAENRRAGRIRFTTDVAEATNHGQIQFIAVGTPPGEDGSADLSYAIAAARNIGRHMNEYKVVVDKSTVPVGTADRVQAAIAEELEHRGSDLTFAVISNPEFLKEGAAIEDFQKPDRIIIGGDDDRALDLMRRIYAPFNRNHDRLITMDARSAELTKYAANAMLATRISFMNELANLAEHLGADIEQVRQGIGSDPRIGFDFLYPGAGYGGSCFPKDVKALIQTARHSALGGLRILEAVEAVNQDQKTRLAAKIKQRLGDDLSGRHFALWGLAFKPRTDDMREASSLVLIDELLAAGATIAAYDPAAMEVAAALLGQRPGIRFADSAAACLEGADALVIVTEWNEFRSPDFERLRARLKEPMVFDGRNLFEPEEMMGMGFEYFAFGRVVSAPAESGAQRT
ncbi:MAG: UDP-glucose/GDP-mannose dehydrogenase family protein [Wenzhouxiangella sp.]|nr:UDP-glucose/GDP-mannose dehydrogenase family protein [Wenzhouxiangella sp.]TVR95003.1 MAG: UDP-glucose/GDP-mannose dehydrogenase family protein [Wenzhouxiangellaceae bacterium]